MEMMDVAYYRTNGYPYFSPLKGWALPAWRDDINTDWGTIMVFTWR